MVWINDPLPEDSKLAIPVRRIDEGGTIGRPIKLKSNYFKIEFSKQGITINHFDVKITVAQCIQKEELCEKPKNNETLSASKALEDAPEPSSVKKIEKEKKQVHSNGSSYDANTGTSKASSAIPGSIPAASHSYIPKAVKQRIFEAFIEESSLIFDGHVMAYDGGSSAYSTTVPTPLKTNGLVEKFEFKDPEQTRNKLYKIECKLVGQAKLRRLFSHLTKLEHMPKTCQTICQGLEVMFNYERTQRFVTAPGNRFFSPDLKLFGPNFDVGRGKEGVSGFAMSLRLCQGWNGAGVVLLNIDILHVVFYRPLPVLDYLKTLPNGRKLFKNPTKPLSPEAIRVIEEKIKNKVQVVIMNTQQKNQRKYLVDRVSSVGPEMHTFEVERGNPASQRSVAKHFLDTHGITLKYPKLNCFVMTKGGAYVPIEVCQIAPKQLVQEKLSGTENKEVIKQTAVKPQDRQEKIKKIFKENKFDEDPALRLLGVSIEDDLVSTVGRVLPSPVVELQTRPNVGKGEWRICMKDKFHQPAELSDWGLLNFSSDEAAPDRIRELKEELIKLAKNKAMNPQEPLFDEDLCIGDCEYMASFLKKLKMNNPRLQLVVFIMDEENQTVYNLMKSLCEDDLNITTQCVQVKTLERISTMLITNILLKFNAKLGKLSHVAFYNEQNYPMQKLSLDGVMVMGADVNHPGGEEKIPSMVAVVASVDEFASRYVHEVRHQPSRRSIIEDMQEITQNLLEQYRTETGSLPKRIIMYRDGVSDTQFTAVVALELKAMRDACVPFGKDYKPSMTFVCVQKRHHTRLFCEDEQEADRSGNVPAGTVVDTVITTHSTRNFFLCSHAGIQGTSIPSHYTVLWDDSNLTMDQLELLTYLLCHNYARCFRVVSLPSPVFYADRASYRAKIRLDGKIQQNPQKWEEARLSSKDGKYPEEFLTAAVRVDKDMETSKKMYFV